MTTVTTHASRGVTLSINNCYTVLKSTAIYIDLISTYNNVTILQNINTITKQMTDQLDQNRPKQY